MDAKVSRRCPSAGSVPFIFAIDNSQELEMLPACEAGSDGLGLKILVAIRRDINSTHTNYPML